MLKVGEGVFDDEVRMLIGKVGVMALGVFVMGNASCDMYVDSLMVAPERGEGSQRAQGHQKGLENKVEKKCIPGSVLRESPDQPFQQVDKLLALIHDDGRVTPENRKQLVKALRDVPQLVRLAVLGNRLIYLYGEAHFVDVMKLIDGENGLVEEIESE